MNEIESSSLVGSRVVVTGMSGAGKSTFAKVLSAKTGLPLIHLDLHIWNPGWVRVSDNELLEKQHVLLADERWIVDSNDVDNDLLVKRADTLIILATPWWVCAWRAFRRGLRRPPDSQLPDGCKESTLQRIGDEWGIIWRNWQNRKSVPEHDRALASRCRKRLKVHILSSKGDLASFADSV